MSAHAARSEQASELCFLRDLRQWHVTNPLMVRNHYRKAVLKNYLLFHNSYFLHFSINNGISWHADERKYQILFAEVQSILTSRIRNHVLVAA